MSSVPRDHAAEQRLLDVAAAAAGLNPPPGERHPVVLSLEAAARPRANLAPNGGPADEIWMPAGRDLLADGREELIDCAAHYFLWEAVRCEPGLIAGEHEATVRYDVAMRTLSCVLEAWRELHTTPA